MKPTSLLPALALVVTISCAAEYDDMYEPMNRDDSADHFPSDLPDDYRTECWFDIGCSAPLVCRPDGHTENATNRCLLPGEFTHRAGEFKSRGNCGSFCEEHDDCNREADDANDKYWCTDGFERSGLKYHGMCLTLDQAEDEASTVFNCH